MQKGLGRFSTAQQAVTPRAADVAIPSASGVPEVAPPAGPPINAYLLVDGHSLEVHRMFADLTHEYDAASGRRLDQVLIGDGTLSGPNFKAGRTPDERSRDESAAARYVRTVVQTGREPFHLVEQYRELAARFRVPLEQLPCVAFVRNVDQSCIGILTISVDWYVAAPARQAFGRAWEQCLTTVAQAGDLASLGAGGLDAAIAEMRNAIILAITRASQPAADEDLPIPPGIELYIRTGNRTVQLAGQDVTLTRTPFELLAELARRPGVFVPQDELLRTVAGRARHLEMSPPRWTQDHARKIRQAFREIGLEKAKADALIEVKNSAYRLNLPPDRVLVR